MQISRREFTVLMSSAAIALAAPRVSAQALRVRREIRTLSPTDLDALRAGVQAMRALPKENFRSWLYQAGVHGAPAADSVGVPDAGTYWNQCVHGGLHFLSWHRWELLFIEEVMRLMSGHCEFTLPYWDYIANGFLPDPLRVPADATNPLYNSTRAAALNNGSGGLSGLNLAAMSETAFANFSGILYGNPHSAVHGLIGGNMGSVPTAARDPVFYLHHCNIDRYWECWSKSGKANPGAPWTTDTFPFRTLSGHRDARAGDVGRTSDVGYTYDNLPCRERFRPDLSDLLRNLRFITLRVRPRPIPEPDPWPWAAVLTTEPFVITGQPLAVVLPQAELQKANMAAQRIGEGPSAAVTLRGVTMSRAAQAGGFFIEAWIAPAKALRAGNLQEAQQIGSFSGFDLTLHAGHEGRQGTPSIALPVGEQAMRLIAGAQEDLAVVFVRRGLVDSNGKPVDGAARAELFKVEGLGLEVARR
ncbi:tyrosinase family protein [Lysobacter terrae]